MPRLGSSLRCVAAVGVVVAWGFSASKARADTALNPAAVAQMKLDVLPFGVTPEAVVKFNLTPVPLPVPAPHKQSLTLDIPVGAVAAGDWKSIGVSTHMEWVLGDTPKGADPTAMLRLKGGINAHKQGYVGVGVELKW